MLVLIVFTFVGLIYKFIFPHAIKFITIQPVSF